MKVSEFTIELDYDDILYYVDEQLLFFTIEEMTLLGTRLTELEDTEEKLSIICDVSVRPVKGNEYDVSIDTLEIECANGTVIATHNFTDSFIEKVEQEAVERYVDATSS